MDGERERRAVTEREESADPGAAQSERRQTHAWLCPRENGH
jgi:hypothetical protein